LRRLVPWTFALGRTPLWSETGHQNQGARAAIRRVRGRPRDLTVSGSHFSPGETMNRALLGVSLLLTAGLATGCGSSTTAPGDCENCSGDGDNAGDGDNNNDDCKNCNGDGDGDDTGDGDGDTGDGDGDQGDGDGDGDNGDGDGDGDNGDGDGDNGDGDGDDDDEPKPIPGMLPPGVDPTKPDTIPKDPNPGENTDAEELLRKAVRFYGGQRCGDGGNYLLAGHGDECHWHDGEDYGPNVDMTGGWHDAGDSIKFTLTTSWASYALLKIYDVYPDAFDDQYGDRNQQGGNGVPDLLDQAKYAVDYLVRIHPAADELVARIGGDQDHYKWVSSYEQTELSYDEGGGARPVNPNGEAGADIAGMTSASLALMSRLWKAYDADRAATYLQHAKEIYAYGNSHQKLTSDNFYEADDYKKYMLCGAVELYRASGDEKYFTEAVMWDDETGEHDYAPDWSTPVDYCRHSLAQLGTDDTLNYWKKDAAHYQASISDRPNVRGLMVVEGCEWGSLACASGAGTSSAFLYDLLGTQSYADFANGQLDFILGDNEHNRSCVVGFGNNAPQHPHHRNSAVLGVPLGGAQVGGPTADVYVDEEDSRITFPAGYNDNQDDYVHNEVAIDYNTGLVGLAAFRVAQERRK
jgi:hypothetical protein